MSVVVRDGAYQCLLASIRDRLARGRLGQIGDTPKDFNGLSHLVYNLIVGSNRLAIQAAADRARSLGHQTMILSTALQGETREVAHAHAEILREVTSSGNPVAPPACILSCGEATVTVYGSGKGGGNQEFGLAAAISMAGLPGGAVDLAAGTDGTDGPTDAVGALVDGTTAARGFSLVDHLNCDESTQPCTQWGTC